jgi:hypothetical protein
MKRTKQEKNLIDFKKRKQKERIGNFYYDYAFITKKGLVYDKIGTNYKYITLTNKVYKR